MAFSADSDLVAIGATSGKIYIWFRNPGIVFSLAFSQLASGSGNAIALGY
jgi:hypothetical protein